MQECPRCRKLYQTGTERCPTDGLILVSVDSQTALGGAAAAIVESREQASVQPGTNVGGYEVTGKIGEGGMGEVFSGVHPVIGKQVAIKVLQRAWSRDPNMARRFITEARAVNSIGHENIVDIFAFGELPSGELYLVMELLSGESLGERLDHPPPVAQSEAVQILSDVCDALAAAHQSGIVHRDLKPDNIFLTQSKTGKRTTKLLDFGIAKLMGAGKMGSTQTGMAVGTPHYMSPEQCLGKEVDARSDIYSLGVIMYQVFTSRLPFSGEAFIEVMNGHLTGRATDPQTLAKMPLRLANLILACMRKAQGERPTLSQIRDDLAKVSKELSGGTVPLAESSQDQPASLKTVSQKHAAPPTPVTAKPAPVKPKPEPVKAKAPSPVEADFLALRKDREAVPKMPTAKGKDPAILDVIDELERSAKNLGGRKEDWKTVNDTARRRKIETRRQGSWGVALLLLAICGAGGFFYFQRMHRPDSDEDSATEQPLPEPKRSEIPAVVEDGFGHLKVKTNEVKANFLVDGVIFSKDSAVLDVSVKPGSRKLEVSAHGYRTVSKTLDVQANKQVLLEITMQRRHH